MPPQSQSLEKWTKYARRDNQFSHWTIAVSDQWFGALLALVTVFHWVISTLIPLSEDELYYYAWSQNLQLSFFDHPPLVALLIRLSTTIFGNTPFGIRFFSTPIALIIVYAIGRLAPGKRILTAALFTPLFLWAPILMTPDVPLLLFWTLYFLWAVKLTKRYSEWGDDPIARVYRNSPVQTAEWCLGGILLGLGSISKYTMFLAPICLLLCLFKFRLSSWFKGFGIHLILASILFSPVIVFNHQFDYGPFLFQWNHGTATDSVPFRFFWEYLGSQAILIGLLPALICLWQTLRLREVLEYPILKCASVFFTLPFFFFSIQAIFTKVEANWGLMAYVSLLPLTQLLLEHASFRLESNILLLVSFIPSFLVSLFFGIHTLFPGIIPPEKDRINRLKETHVFYQDLKNRLDFSKDPVFATTYQNVAFLRYVGINADQIKELGRNSQFTLQPQSPCSQSSAIVIQESPEPLITCLPKAETILTQPIKVRETVVHTLYIIRYSN